MATSEENPGTKLRVLAADPAAQGAYALELLRPKTRRDVLVAALDVLARNPNDEAHDALCRLYAHFDANNGAGDPGTYMRSRIVRALRPVARMSDMKLLEKAVTTYEFPPPEFKEEGALLRSAALVVLANLDDHLARYYATQLLADGYSDPMSGEPAISAVVVLSELGELLPVYFYALLPEGKTLPEVTGECLRHLDQLPARLTPQLVRRYGDSDHAVEVIGLFDFLIAHSEGPLAVDFMIGYAEKTNNLDVFRYLMTAWIASGDAILLDALVQAGRFEQDQGKIAILLDACALNPSSQELHDLSLRLEKRLSAR